MRERASHWNSLLVLMILNQVPTVRIDTTYSGQHAKYVEFQGMEDHPTGQTRGSNGGRDTLFAAPTTLEKNSLG